MTLPDLSMTHGLSFLAIGGIIAAVAAGWRQVRSFAVQIASLVVITADLSNNISRVVWKHIHQNTRVVPSGIMTFAGEYHNLDGDSMPVPVPFRLINPHSMHYSWKYGILLANRESGTLKLTAIRGLTNFQRLIADASVAQRVRTTRYAKNNELQTNRFVVHTVMGREKIGGFESRSHSDGAAPAIAQGSDRDSTTNSSDMSKFQISEYDHSFLWPTSMYLRDTKKNDPLKGLYFEPEILAHFRQAKQWLELGDWYVECGIPWRKGWLLYGPGGTGKSSIAKALGKSLEIPVYQYYLGTLSDQEFSSRWENMDKPCIALFEDFDSVFNGRTPMTEHKSLTYDTVLNHMSGVQSASGIFVVITTNNLDKIDPAMGVSVDGQGTLSTRPGRIDSVIKVGAMSEGNRRKMLSSILRNWLTEVETLVQSSDGMTPSQVQEIGVQRAFELMALDPELNKVTELRRAA